MTATDTIPSVVEVRDIRVMVSSGKEPIRFRVSGRHELRDSGGRLIGTDQGRQWSEVKSGQGITLAGRTYNDGRIQVIPGRGGTFELSRWRDGKWTPAGRYGGKLTLLSRGGGQLLAINEVDVETYLAGVLVKELYPNFHREAYRAQAVAARTYALYQMSRHANRDYDVVATEASQVYGGLAVGRSASTAIEAVRYTRGIVCTWTSPEGERIFCTYYSSACGGRSQNAADCKPIPSIPPLSGGVKCDYCRIAKGDVYRWGPTRISKKDISRRLVRRYPKMAELGGVRTVEVASRTRFGRPGKIRIVGATGKAYELRAEDFRLAVGSRIMRSTACELTDQGDHIELSNGQGFGHGMGLCQWGAQGQALAGRNASEIIKYYYPKVHLTRAY